MAKVGARREATGGASFSPRLQPRPQYPPVSEFLRKTLVAYTRAPALMALATAAVFPAYRRFVRGLARRGWSERKIFMVLTCAVHSGMYFGVNGLFFLCERLGLLERFRMVHRPAQEPTVKLVRATLIEAIVGQAITAPLATYFIFDKCKSAGMAAPDARLPGLFQMYKHFAIAHFFNNFFFYWAHRLVHAKPLYARIHKQHHNWLATRSIGAEYAHPIEQVLANTGPSVGSMLLFGRHPLVFWMWLAFRLEETYEAHSNYYFGDTFLAKIGLTHAENAAFHSAHHSVNRGNFGFWHLDWLFGTMDSYLADGGTEGYVSKHLRNAPSAAE